MDFDVGTAESGSASFEGAGAESRLITRECVDIAVTTTGELIITGAAATEELEVPAAERGEKLHRGAISGAAVPRHEAAARTRLGQEPAPSVSSGARA